VSLLGDKRGNMLRLSDYHSSLQASWGSFDSTDQDGDVPLLSAMKDRNPDIIGLFLKAPGISIRSPIACGDRELTPLEWALADENVIVIGLLLEDLASISNINTLHWAARKGHAEIVRMLLRIPEIDINAQDIHGCTPLMTAIHNGKRCYQEFLQHPTIGLGIRSTSGCTVLHFAAGWREPGQSPVIKDLLVFCSDLVISRDKSGVSALHLITRGQPSEDRTQALRALLQTEKIKVVQRNRAGLTPLHLAAVSGNEEVCRLPVVWMDKDPSFEDDRGYKPSDTALSSGYVDLYDYLKKFGDRTIAVAENGASSGTDDVSERLDGLFRIWELRR
jgi:ankyrin repeat protein